MPASEPAPISKAELRRRLQRVRRIAKRLGFVGQVEYRHVYSRSGGAQYGVGSDEKADLLIVYAEAFERDANSTDFTLEAILAHERGHQVLSRHPSFRALLLRWNGQASEEMIASIVGSLIVESKKDARMLMMKAVFEVALYGVTIDDAIHLVTEIQRKLEKLL
ncbi:MAG: hypothetical protein L0Y72_14405 [Gemmataceae bacterium]|nr:hypothetical protein [Gemmataceae bacterium]MCI0640256.1 hypothetical protein [Gemmataceae bacterium]MCI0740235.1 hypothetical protein [Gemmataceae bacterium]